MVSCSRTKTTLDEFNEYLTEIAAINKAIQESI